MSTNQAKCGLSSQDLSVRSPFDQAYLQRYNTLAQNAIAYPAMNVQNMPSLSPYWPCGSEDVHCPGSKEGYAATSPSSCFGGAPSCKKYINHDINSYADAVNCCDYYLSHGPSCKGQAICAQKIPVEQNMPHSGERYKFFCSMYGNPVTPASYPASEAECRSFSHHMPASSDWDGQFFVPPAPPAYPECPQECLPPHFSCKKTTEHQ